MNMNIPRYNLDSCAMLVEFNASIWTARKLDRKVTDEVVHDKNAGAKNSARVNKYLLAGRNEIELITAQVSAARQFVYTSTLPWSDNGQRLLPAAQYLAFDQRMSDFESDFTQLVSQFVTVYPTLITAQAMQLGDMFNRNDFPVPAEIKQKFNWRLSYLPVPTANDFRIQVGDDAQKELREKLEAVATERVAAAHQDLWGRLYDHLTRMADRLKVDTVNGEEKPRRFHDTLVTGGLELCDTLKDLNLLGDEKLETARLQLKQALLGVDADELRKNVSARQHVEKEVQDILDKFSI